MYHQILKEIKKYETIVIARHVGVDPDALCSQLALRDSLRLKYPKKKIYAVGNGSTKFLNIGILDKVESAQNFLLIILDTPDRKRIDCPLVDSASMMIKIDHHPFVEKFGEIEYIDETKGSTCEILMDLIKTLKLPCNSEIAQTLYCGLVSDTNRFLFDSTTSHTFQLVSYYLEKYPFVLSEVYKALYLRPLKEVRLQGYIAENFSLTENGVLSIKLTNEDIVRFKADSASAGNMINNFNFIEEALVWVIVTEDLKNNNIRINIRSRGPIINQVAEKYSGGGHAFASGARVSCFEEADLLIHDLDEVCKNYIKGCEENEDKVE